MNEGTAKLMWNPNSENSIKITYRDHIIGYDPTDNTWLSPGVVSGLKSLNAVKKAIDNKLKANFKRFIVLDSGGTPLEVMYATPSYLYTTNHPQGLSFKDVERHLFENNRFNLGVFKKLSIKKQKMTSLQLEITALKSTLIPFNIEKK